MEKLIRDIKQWGLDRGIDKCDPLLQTTKTLEECMELQRAIIRYDMYKQQRECINCINVRTEVDGLQCPTMGKYPSDMGDICKNYEPVSMDSLIDIKDAIGDIFITLVMIDLQAQGADDMLLRNFNYQSVAGPFENVLFMSNDIKIMQERILRKQGGYYFNLENIIRQLSATAIDYHLTLKQCVEYAYNEIKDRKGSIVDGLFVKEAS